MMNEAPLSWNATYITPDGWVCQLTIRGESGQELFDRVRAATQWLSEQGCVPGDRHGNPTVALPKVPQQEGNGHMVAAAANGKSVPVLANGQPDPSWCPIHGVEMKFYQKDGRSWYSHRTEDGHWCSGKPKKGSW